MEEVGQLMALSRRTKGNLLVANNLFIAVNAPQYTWYAILSLLYHNKACTYEYYLFYCRT